MLDPVEEDPCCSTYGWTSNLPVDLDPDVRADLVPGRRPTAQELQRAGQVATHLAGRRRVRQRLDLRRASNDELHDLLSGLPLFPYMDIEVTPLAMHPSDVNA